MVVKRQAQDQKTKEHAHPHRLFSFFRSTRPSAIFLPSNSFAVATTFNSSHSKYSRWYTRCPTHAKHCAVFYSVICIIHA